MKKSTGERPMLGELIFREMRLLDIDEVHAIETASFSMPWSKESLRHELDDDHGAHYIVAVQDGKVVGYAGFWQVFDEAHITNIAVHPAYRKQGIGRKLMQEMDSLCKHLGILYQTLEVRVGNTAARRLYQNVGFYSAGIRKGFYEKPKEDADILWKEL